MKKVRTTALVSVGSGLEYYDFIIYALLASFISAQFFPAHANPISSLISTFAIFSLGYFMRPIGALIFGHLGDRFGRKKSFLIALLIMAFSTLAISVLPTYSQIGGLAVVLLALLRALQGLAFGGELSGAVVFLSEHQSRYHRGFHCGLLLMGVSFGAALGSLVTYVLTDYLSSDQMHVWGWRIPFLLGGGLAVLGFIIRRQLDETQIFKDLTVREKVPAFTLVRRYTLALIQGLCFASVCAAFIIFPLSLPSILNHFYHFKLSDIYLSMTLGLLWAGILIPGLGSLSDRVGRKNILLFSCSVIIVSIFPLFYLLESKGVWGLYLFTFLYQTLVVMMSMYSTLLAELFPTNIRYTGASFTYNSAFSIASLFPMLAMAIVKATGNPQNMSFLLIALSVIGLIGVAFIKVKKHQVL